jgi:hypothetical protein
LALLEAHGHWGDDAVWMIVHLKDLLLLGSEVLRLVLSIHDGETH